MTFTYVGLENFIRVFNDRLFWNSLMVTVFFTIASVLVELILGITLVFILPKKNFLVTLFILTMMISPVGVALIWRFLLYPNIGVFDSFAQNFLGFHIPWLGDPFWAKMTIVIVDVWHWTGFVFLIIYAGYSSLPITVFEAAQVDGASSFQRFVRIALPLLKPTIAVALFFRTVDVLQAFPELWQLTFGGPAYSTTILNILVYIATFDMCDWSYAAVVSLFLMLISLIIAIFYSLYIRRV